MLNIPRFLSKDILPHEVGQKGDTESRKPLKRCGIPYERAELTKRLKWSRKNQKNLLLFAAPILCCQRLSWVSSRQQTMVRFPLRQRSSSKNDLETGSCRRLMR